MGAHRHTGAGIGDARDVEPVDLRVARLAATQHGAVTRGQLLDAGLGRHAIAHRLERGRLHVIHRGVHAVGHEPLSPRCLQLAAVLACGSGGALWHRSAAELWTLLPERHDEALHDSVPCQRRAPAGVNLHRTTNTEVTRRHGIPVTRPARTIVDLAATVEAEELERALEQVRLRRLVSTHDLVRRAHDRPGAARLRPLLGYEPSFTRSEAERRLLSLLATAQLPSPRTNVRGRGPRGGRGVAAAATRRRGRRPHVPRKPGRVRARPRQGRGAAGARIPGHPRHLAPAERAT
jgi:hypothetical protein